MKFAVLSDLHAQYENPVARLDDYFDTLIRKLRWVRETIGRDTPLIIAGDIWDVGKPRNFLKMHGPMCDALKNCHTIYGNHDASFHSAQYLPETAYASIDRVLGCHLDKVRPMGDFELHPFNFGTEIQHEDAVYDLPMIAVSHQFVYQKKLPFDKGVSALYLLTEFPEYAIIITGDNHQHFIEEYDGRVLINNGSLMRMTSAQIDYQPVVTVWEDGVFTTIPIPVNKDAVTDKHITFANDRGSAHDAMLAYIELVKNADNEVYDFTSNLYSRIEQLGDTLTKRVLTEVYHELKEGV